MKTSESKKTFTEELKGTASEIINQVKKIIKEGNARRLLIKDEKGKVLFQTQLTAGIAGTALITAMAPIVSAISMFALFMNDVKIIVEKYPADEMGEDEYEVEAEAEVIVDIEDEEEEKEKDKKKETEAEEKTDKTVGKKEDDNDSEQ
ncbi:MAG: DUF4342 domain-containing protein [Balneolaceae bacterium]|nr:DUF4342 domain-containing protein [Balneolaceae bacterium]